ncbi:sugar transferase [Knoellia sp. LjRoot47]|uniref:sugar transferase n=1 Tax=Knoellia sp. LjRoot47 TaxID=3342330 RepID=UPI003ECE337A
MVSDVFSGVMASVVAAIWAPPVAHGASLFVLTPIAWVAAVALNQGYLGRNLGHGAEEYSSVARAGAVLLGAIGLTSFMLTLTPARSHIVVVATLVIVSSLVIRRALRAWLVRQRRDGRYRQRTIVVGTVGSASELIRELRRSPSNFFDITGACVSGAEDVTDVDGVPVVGNPRDVALAVDFNDADIVAVSGHPGLSGRDLRELAWELEDRQVDLVISPGIFEVAGPRLSLRAEAGVSLLHLERPGHTPVRLRVKRLQDLLLAPVIVVLALPILLLIAAAIRLDSPGPIFFRQTRIGQRGQEFSIFKFRTMRVDAEAHLAALAAEGHEVNSVLFKSRTDPRITRVGRVLRRFSLDEVPQLFNVLHGEMSLVGPRPGLAAEVDKYEPDAMRRLRVRPGMTGLWQVSGRSTLDWEQTVRLDLWYVDNWSSMLDLQILIRTARAVIGGNGAY